MSKAKKAVDAAVVASCFTTAKGLETTTTRSIADGTAQVKITTTVERPDLEAFVAEWAPTMGLGDWDIKAKYERGMKDRGSVGYSLRSRAALIRVQDPLDYADGEDWQPDPELTVVHELAHLHFAPFEFAADTKRDIFEDQAVHAFARALIKLKRGKLGSAP